MIILQDSYISQSWGIHQILLFESQFGSAAPKLKKMYIFISYFNLIEFESSSIKMVIRMAKEYLSTVEGIGLKDSCRTVWKMDMESLLGLTGKSIHNKKNNILLLIINYIRICKC